MRAISMSLTAAVAMAATSLPTLADYMVKEVGSFHVGGRTATLSGMPTKDVVFIARRAADQGRSERRVRGRADVRAVRQAGATEGQGPAAAVARRRPHRRHLGDQARRQARLAAVLPQRRLRRLCLRRGRARARVVGALSGNLQVRADVPHQEGSLGAVPHRAELRDRRQRGSRSKASSFRSRRSTSSPNRACRAGRPTTRRPRTPTTRWCRKSAPASSWCTARAATSASTPR